MQEQIIPGLASKDFERRPEGNLLLMGFREGIAAPTEQKGTPASSRVRVPSLDSFLNFEAETCAKIGRLNDNCVVQFKTSAQLIQQHLIDEAREITASQRWQYPDASGSARIKEFCQRLTSHKTYRAFSETPEGDYLLTVIEAYEEDLNDHWLPFEIVGLPLDQAREFISSVATELQKNSAPVAILRLRECYSRLAASF